MKITKINSVFAANYIYKLIAKPGTKFLKIAPDFDWNTDFYIAAANQ
jgi:hypothetical protein